MKLLFALDNYDHGSGGAEMCVRSLARELSRRGHEIEVIQGGAEPAGHVDGPIRVHERRLPRGRLVRDRNRDTLRWNEAWRAALGAFLATHRPDLVLTQNRLLSSTVEVARSRGIPVVAWIHAYAMVCPRQFVDRDPFRDCTGECRACQPWLWRGAARRVLAGYRRALAAADVVFANSRFTQRVLRERLALDSELLYPPVELDRYTAEAPPRDRVLFVKPQYVKGFPIFVEVARRLPGTRFLVAGRPGSRARRVLAGLGNVECTGWTEDMARVYARGRVLLGPSIWPEPFGRVFVEAGAGGVPSVASARGGIPEAVGPGGILVDDVFEVDRWVEALRELEAPEAWTRCSERAREHARGFTPQQTVHALAEAVGKTVGLAL